MSVLLAFLFSSYAALVTSVPEGSKHFYDLKEAEPYFNAFIKEYKRNYANDGEKQRRFEIFKDNLSVINKQNSEEELAVFGITNFADMDPKERCEYSGYIERAKEHDYTPIPDFEWRAPDSFDWRDQNKVSQVKNQGHCGSCWAFSTIGVIEGQYAIKYNNISMFSEQQLVDCNKAAYGCQGGWDSDAVIYIIQAGGIMSEQDYPYTAKDNQCSFDASKVAAKLTHCLIFDPKNDEETLKELLYQYGPLGIAIDASAIVYYKSSIISKCPFKQLSHAVLLVGYGTENNIPYWTLKNSWGAKWGETGYFRIKRGINACGLTNGDIVSAVLA